jgi:hypothetical protein
MSTIGSVHPTLSLQETQQQPEYLAPLLPIAERSAHTQSSSSSISNLISSAFDDHTASRNVSGSARRHTDAPPMEPSSHRQAFSTAPGVYSLISPRKSSVGALADRHIGSSRRLSVQCLPSNTPTSMWLDDSSTASPSSSLGASDSSSTTTAQPVISPRKHNSKFKKWATSASRAFTAGSTCEKHNATNTQRNSKVVRSEQCKWCTGAECASDNVVD